MNHSLFVPSSMNLFCYIFLLVICFLSRVTPKQISKTIMVGSGGEFNTIQAAIDSVPGNNSQWIKIHVKAGVYKEKVCVSKGFIYLEGAGRGQTIISWDDRRNSTDSPDDLDDLGSAIDFAQNAITTELSATFAVSGDNFVATGITFRNHYGILTPGPPAQAVAASVSGDKNSFYECGFVGIQDTLLDYHGRHLFHSCYIEGVVDFIFGFAQSIYKDCTVNVQANSRSSTQGYVTAQGRSGPDSTAFVFVGGSVDGDGPTYLGRAWGNHSRVLYIGTVLSEIVVPQGWYDWGKDPSTLYYAEFNCSGPGSNSSQRVSWQAHPQATDVTNFTSLAFIDNEGWLTQQPQKPERRRLSS